MIPPLVLDVEQIKKLLPHRAPLLLVERLDDIVPGESATGYKAVSFNEPLFRRPFSRLRAVMPGVLIVEAMAQTAGALVVHSLGMAGRILRVYFMTIEKARFRKPVVPGDMLRMPVKLLRMRGPVWKFEGQAFVGDTLCAEAEFSAMITDAARPALRPIDGMHPTALVEDGAVLGAGVEIGPFCHVGARVTLGEGVRLLSHVSVDGRHHDRRALGGAIPAPCWAATARSAAMISPMARLEIGEDCVLREMVSMNVGSRKGGGVTTVGAKRLFHGQCPCRP